MPRLRRTSPDQPGWGRRRAGRGFTYFDNSGNRLTPEQAQRVKDLVIPPAWRDVWICPHPNGHLQAVGTDDAGRRQYLYHPQWRTRRDQAKFDRVLAAAEHLPAVRRRLLKDLGLPAMPRERATALAVRLIDLGCFRIGSDAYADTNGSFGLTTLERGHVRRAGEELAFRFVGKSGVEHDIRIADEASLVALEVLRKRRDESPRLLAWRADDGTWHDLDAAAVNAYLAELFAGELTAKDFRTWHATVLAASTLAELGVAATKTARKKSVRDAVVAVSEYLGNTPTVARGSYIDPRVIDAYESGMIVELPGSRVSPARRQALIEQAVRELLG